MTKKDIPSGVVHKMPADLRKALTSDPKALLVWEDITPLARDEEIKDVGGGGLIASVKDADGNIIGLIQ